MFWTLQCLFFKCLQFKIKKIVVKYLENPFVDQATICARRGLEKKTRKHRSGRYLSVEQVRPLPAGLFSTRQHGPATCKSNTIVF